MLQALQEFKNLAVALGPPPKGADPRYVSKLLANALYAEALDTLRFLDECAGLWPSLAKKLAQQTSESQFRQTLAELRLLSHFKRHGVHAAPVPATRSKHHDIDVVTAGIHAKIEIYSPSDGIDLPLFDQHLAPLFKFLDGPSGFHLDLKLESLGVGTVKCASNVGTVRQVERWLANIGAEAAAWINAAPAAGAAKSWEGPNKSVRLTAELHALSGNRADRVVRCRADTQSGRPSSWAKKIFDKMSERQCGECGAGQVRVLIVDFSGLGAGSKDIFGTTGGATSPRIEGALESAAADAGESISYDGVVPVWAGDPVIFAEVIALHPRAAADLQALVGVAALATVPGEARSAGAVPEPKGRQLISADI